MQLMVLGSARDDALQHVGQPAQRVDTVQPRRGEKRGEDGPIARAAFGTGEEIIKWRNLLNLLSGQPLRRPPRYKRS